METKLFLPLILSTWRRNSLPSIPHRTIPTAPPPCPSTKPPPSLSPAPPTSVPHSLCHLPLVSLPSFLFLGEYDYTRSGNPTRDALQRQLAELDGGARAFCFTTGMAAISAVSRLAQAGDEVIGRALLFLHSKSLSFLPSLKIRISLCSK